MKTCPALATVLRNLEMSGTVGCVGLESPKETPVGDTWCYLAEGVTEARKLCRGVWEGERLKAQGPTALMEGAGF